MTVTIAADAQRLIDRVAAVNRASQVVVDRARAERALVEHFTRLRLEVLPVTWATDYEGGISAAESTMGAGPLFLYVRTPHVGVEHGSVTARPAARSAARSAAEVAAQSAAESAVWSAVEPHRRENFRPPFRDRTWGEAWSCVDSQGQTFTEAAVLRAASVGAEAAARSTDRWAATFAATSAAEAAARAKGWYTSRETVQYATESAARAALTAAVWSAATSAIGVSHPAIECYIGIWLPFVDALEAGLWVFWVLTDRVIAVPRPVVRFEDDPPRFRPERLHCEDGPAIHWPDGAAYYCWRGVHVSRDIIEQPKTITVPRIDDEANVEIRRVMIERYGLDRFLRDGGATVRHCDETGVLYERPMVRDEPLVMVKVVNSTREPDGSFKEYFIRVPPDMRTAREAVAWTFDIEPARYRPTMET